MKRNTLFLLVLFAVISPLSGELITYKGDLGEQWTIGDNMIVKENELKKKRTEYKYSTINEYSLNYIQMDNKDKKWLMLKSEHILFIYEKGKEGELFFGTNPETVLSKELIIRSRDFGASSSLTEGKKHYSPESLGMSELEKPWVEGVEGDGIGEKFFFTRKKRVKNLYFFNGYVSYEKPSLYEYNNRVKEIVIYDKLNPSFKKEVLLEDTPRPQKIEINGEKMRKLEIEIRAVYNGSRWDDTCINFILIEMF